MKESDCEIIAFIDDDAIPDQRWLQYLIEPFAEPAVAAVAGRVKTLDSRPDGDAYETPRFINGETPQWFEMTTFGGLGLGCNMALRKSTCTMSKVFDERLGRGAPFQIAEEYYAFANLVSRGFTVAYVPAATVFHLSLTQSDIEQEARNSVTYWLLLFSEFPRQRLALLRFLFNRLRHKPLTWPRDPQGPGDIINSHWLVKLKATVTGVFLFLRTKRPRD
jgi:cellulose synthase/poly-beta-1,6-N-acetylglucosamine synthase-like glycosyltransferase